MTIRTATKIEFQEVLGRYTPGPGEFGILFVEHENFDFMVDAMGTAVCPIPSLASLQLQYPSYAHTSLCEQYIIDNPMYAYFSIPNSRYRDVSHIRAYMTMVATVKDEDIMHVQFADRLGHMDHVYLDMQPVKQVELAQDTGTILPPARMCDNLPPPSPEYEAAIARWCDFDGEW